MSLARSFTFAELGIAAGLPSHQTRLQEFESVAQALGIEVTYYPFWSSRISGLLVLEDDGRYCIGVNSAMPRPRQLFSLAHELGHYSLHRHLKDTFLCHGCHAGRQDKLEREANRYAATMLMPGQLVKELVTKGWGVKEMCAYFGVSRAAMEWRVRELAMSSPTLTT